MVAKERERERKNALLLSISQPSCNQKKAETLGSRKEKK
jgi:hypothetical protein